MIATLLLIIEIILLLGYVATAIFITKNTLGIIILGVLTLVIFALVYILEKKREKMKQPPPQGSMPLPVQPPSVQPLKPAVQPPAAATVSSAPARPAIVQPAIQQTTQKRV